jgi:hypothetical protein
MDAGEYLKKLDYKGIIVLAAIALILGVIYSFFINNLMTAIIAMFLAVFGAYFLFTTYFEEEKPVKLMEGEKMILRTLDRGYIMLPGKLGGFMSSKTQRDLDIYLTDKRVIARRSSGDFVFDQYLNTIESVAPERRLMTRYLRVRYTEKGKEKDALLFVGDVDLWLKRLKQVGVKESGIPSEEKTEKMNRFMKDAKTLKEKIAKKE